MAKGESTGTRKRRRKGPALTFRTPSERKKVKSVLGSSTVTVASVSADISESNATTSFSTERSVTDKTKAKGKDERSATTKSRQKQQTNVNKKVSNSFKPSTSKPNSSSARTSSTSSGTGFDSDKSNNNLSKVVGEKGRKKPATRKSVRKPSASQSETLKSLSKTNDIVVRSSVFEASGEQGSDMTNTQASPSTSLRRSWATKYTSPEEPQLLTKNKKASKKDVVKSRPLTRGKRVHTDSDMQQLSDGSPPKIARKSSETRQGKETSKTGSKPTTRARASSVIKTKGAFSKTHAESHDEESRQVATKGKRVSEQDSGTNENQPDSSVSQKTQTSPSKRATKKLGSRVTTQAKEDSIPDRIRDVSVTKKVFEKWKPLTKSTKDFTDEVLKSTALNVMATFNGEDREDAAHVLDVLKRRIMRELPTWRAPPTQGDYRKMEGDNEKSDDLLVRKLREKNELEKQLEEEERLFEEESEKVEELGREIEMCKNELTILENDKAHPLVQQSENVLDLPEFTEELFDTDHASMEQSIEEENLQQTLLRLQKNVTACGLTDWMTKLKDLAKNLES